MHIGIWGDSITWGACDYKNGGWVRLLQSYLKLKPESISVYNCGISGDNTDDLLKRFKIEAEAREPDIVIFAIGINDSQYTGSRENTRVSQEEFIGNLEALVLQAKEFTDKIVFVGLTHVEEEKVMPIPWSDENKNYDNTNIDIYNSIVLKICEKHNLTFIDVLDILEPPDLDDGLHPNTQGHQKMFEVIKKQIEGII